MIRAGFTIENPTTHSRTIVLESDLETQSMGWLLETHCVPKAPPDIAEHMHLTWTETFEIISGTAYYKLNGVQKTAQAGETIVMPPGQWQVHPWNADETELVYRQRDHFGQANPQAMQEVLGVFATLASLAREGKLDRQGRPKDPLQMAITLRTFPLRLGRLACYNGNDH
jgi:mannose-6-phosphate isomerase-like protein (cupin superfamily)